MVRVKRGNVAIKRRKKIFKFAKGYTGAHSRLFRTANQQVMKALVYSYVGEKDVKEISEVFGYVELMLRHAVMV